MKKNTYSSSDIKVLEGLEAVKKRPAMYIGDTENKGLHQLLWEVLDNSIDEFLAGYCTNIIVEIKKFNTICIIDNGRGIPIEIHSNKKSALEIVMTVLHSGGKFDNKTYNISGGLHGVGVSCVNALSEYLIVEINRNGKKYQQKYKKGILFSNLKEIEKSNITGTKIIFIPDRDIFKKNIYNYNIISFRLR
jgi:DNA gyrase subunit B